MSVSPQPSGPTTVVSPLTATRSPTATTVITPGGSGHSNTQLASLLSQSYHEIDVLRRDLDLTRRRAEHAENIVNAIQSASDSSSSQQQLPGEAIRIIEKLENQIHDVQHARDEAEARLRLLMDHWTQLDHYLLQIEGCAADARNGYSRTVTAGGGQLVLASIPLPGQQLPGPLQQQQQQPHNNQSPGNLVMPPPSYPSRHHSSSGHSRGQSHRQQQSSHAWPALPPPPNPNVSGRVRPRAGSMDDAGYRVGAPGQPPAKRSRGDGERDRRMYNEPHTLHQLHAQRGQELDPEARERDEFNRGRLTRASRSMDSSSAQIGTTRGGIPHPSRHRDREHSFSPRSPSQASAGSQDIDEMLLEATTDDRRQQVKSPRHTILHGPGLRGQAQEYHLSYRPESPSEYPGHLYPHPRPRHLDAAHSPGGGPPGSSVMPGPALHADSSGPLPQPGQVQTYQTHIFAPPVTGAPIKKSKFSSGSSGTGAAAGAAASSSGASGSGSAQAQGPNGSIIPVPPPVVTSGSYPAQNAQGQRICRQCGLPGRYKDGKCVEKWGPGPEGPGTVCDRCRKKMKRVERRGTLDGQHPNASVGSMGSQHSHSSIPPRGIQHSLSSDRSVHRTDTLPTLSAGRSAAGGFGPAGTHLISSSSAAFATHDHRDSNPRSHSSALIDRSPRAVRSPPTPPAIATLDDTTESKNGSVRNGDHPSRPASADRRPSTANGHSNKSHKSSGSAPAEPSNEPLKRSTPSSNHSNSSIAKRASPTAMDADIDIDADADADADAEADVDDADLELLEAVDAAEANSSSSEARPKAEDDDVDDPARA